MRGLLALLLLALTTPATAETCPPVERTAGPPVYVILYGYGFRTPTRTVMGLPPPDLPMVDDDVASMARLFEALGPQRMRVHGEFGRSARKRVKRFGLRPPTWASLLESVAEVVADIDADRQSAVEPEVYVYLAGHGEQRRVGDKTRLELYARPDGEAPGYNGYIDSALFAEHILTPLSARARVHLIADTCFSYTLMQTRPMTRIERVVTTPVLPDYATPFRESFPDVGTLLATRAVTYEGPRYGGRFSHALRSAAIGPADVDQDGVITYGEMRRALNRSALADPLMATPHAYAPGSDDAAPFLRWRASEAARVCTPAGAAGGLRDGRNLFATVPDRDAPSALWLSRGNRFTLRAFPSRR